MTVGFLSIWDNHPINKNHERSPCKDHLGNPSYVNPSYS
jgi:hypothetical protein